jgi:lipopolysaccharide/colanic/teichoic acid biosynthesis glycosyltransferase
LDEIPQLFNVLRGDMSLVGPRPEVQEFVDLFTQDEREILTVRPGITDWATLWNADEESLLAGKTDPEQSYLKEIRPGKLRLQLKYVHERSFSQDLSILLQTSRIVVSRLLGGRRGPMSNLRKSTRHPQ